MKALTISSSMFTNNGWMPDECSGYGNDISPDLVIDGKKYMEIWDAQ